MEALRIEILNPKAKKILKGLADLKLISISKSVDSTKEFNNILASLRKNSETAPSLEEITLEVEDVRAERYANK